jgi:hypothetical protein
MERTTRNRSLIPGRRKRFSLSTKSILTLKPNESLIQWAPGLFLLHLSGERVKLTTHSHLVPRLHVEIYLHSTIHLHEVVLN